MKDPLSTLESTQLLVRQLRNSGVMHRIEPLSRKGKEDDQF